MVGEALPRLCVPAQRSSCDLLRREGSFPFRMQPAEWRLDRGCLCGFRHFSWFIGRTSRMLDQEFLETTLAGTSIWTVTELQVYSRTNVSSTENSRAALISRSSSMIFFEDLRSKLSYTNAERRSPCQQCFLDNPHAGRPWAPCKQSVFRCL